MLELAEDHMAQAMEQMRNYRTSTDASHVGYIAQRMQDEIEINELKQKLDELKEELAKMHEDRITQGKMIFHLGGQIVELREDNERRKAHNADLVEHNERLRIQLNAQRPVLSSLEDLQRKILSGMGAPTEARSDTIPVPSQKQPRRDLCVQRPAKVARPSVIVRSRLFGPMLKPVFAFKTRNEELIARLVAACTNTAWTGGNKLVRNPEKNTEFYGTMNQEMLCRFLTTKSRSKALSAAFAQLRASPESVVEVNEGELRLLTLDEFQDYDLIFGATESAPIPDCEMLTYA